MEQARAIKRGWEGGKTGQRGGEGDCRFGGRKNHFPFNLLERKPRPTIKGRFSFKNGNANGKGDTNKHRRAFVVGGGGGDIHFFSRREKAKKENPSADKEVDDQGGTAGRIHGKDLTSKETAPFSYDDKDPDDS